MRARPAALLALGLVLLLAIASAARAATINVTTTSDGTAMDGKVSIREALESINAGADLNADVTHTGTYGMSDTVVIPASSAHYAVTLGELVANKTMTITGAGPASTVMDAGGASRVLHLTGGGTATISGVTITGGHTTASPGGAGIRSENPTLHLSNSAFTANTAAVTGGVVQGGGALWLASGATIDSTTFTGNTFTGTGGTGFDGGGAIMNSNLSLTVTNSTFENNSATISTGPNNGGGAIYSDGSIETLTNDTFRNNSAQITAGGVNPQLNGGGANYQDGSGLTVTGSTFSGNSVSITGASATSGGGALFHQGSDMFTLTNSTFTGNSASPLGAGAATGGGGILTNSPAQMTILNDTLDANSTSGVGGNLLATNSGVAIASGNTIFAGGSAANGGSNCGGPGAFDSAGHDIEDSTPSQCGLHAGNDRIGVAPLLGPLASNGGPTQTQELLAGSPAIDGGPEHDCPATDQRGIGRPAGSECDIGAVEVLPPSAATGGASAVGKTSATLSGSASNSNSVIGGTVFFQFGRTTAYGSQTAASPLSASAGPTSFSAPATGLPAGTPIHFRAVASTPDGTSVGADATFITAPASPSLSSLKIAPSSFPAEAGRGASIAARRRATGGAFVSFKDSQAGKTTFTVQRPVRGFRSGRRCAAKRPRGHRGKLRRCTLYRSLGSFSHTDLAGSNRFHFSGRVHRRGLRPGRYRLRAVARNAAGDKSRTRSVKFSIVR
jgi:hypothetical protein